MAPTVPVEQLRAAENVGIALANQLKAAGADDIVRAAKKTIEDEIMMQKAERDAAIKTVTSDVTNGVTNKVTKGVAANVTNGVADNVINDDGANNATPTNSAVSQNAVNEDVVVTR